jgi:predicted component of type VI protein secretion system
VKPAEAAADPLLRPIPGENPAGIDLRYQRLYLHVREARRADDAESPGVWHFDPKLPDWAAAARLTSEALEHTSKDLQLAAWYTEARMHTDGFEGIAHGLEVTLGLLRNFWDVVYPEMDDGDPEMRLGIFEWLDRVVSSGASELPVTDDSKRWIREAVASVDGIEAYIRQEFRWLEEPVLGRTREALSSALERPPASVMAEMPVPRPEPREQVIAPNPPSRENFARAMPAPQIESREAAETGRARFLGKLEVAERCLAEGRFALAARILEPLAEQVDYFRLEVWEEPALAARVWIGLCRAYAEAQPGSPGASRRAFALDRLCSVHPAAAYELGEF